MNEQENHSRNDPFKDLVQCPEKAMEAIFECYEAELYQYVKKFISDDDIIKDVIQETLIALWKQKEKIAVLDTPFFYMLRIAKYQALSIVRELQRKNTFPLEENYDVPGTDKADGKLRLQEIDRQIREITDTLTPREREIFIESRFLGLSNKEIMERHNMAEQTVKNYLSRTLKVVREGLKDLLTLFI